MVLSAHGIVAVHNSVDFLRYVQVFLNLGEIALGVVVADTAGDAPALGEGLVQFEADYGILSLGILVGMAPVGSHFEGIFSIVVVAVDNDERTVDDILRHQHGMCGTPWLLALRIQGETCRYLVQFLGDEDELQRSAVDALDIRILFRHKGFHVFEEVFAHDVHDLAEASLDGIVYGIINNGFTGGAEAVHLFESAIAAAHTGSEN